MEFHKSSAAKWAWSKKVYQYPLEITPEFCNWQEIYQVQWATTARKKVQVLASAVKHTGIQMSLIAKYVQKTTEQLFQ